MGDTSGKDSDALFFREQDLEAHLNHLFDRYKTLRLVKDGFDVEVRGEVPYEKLSAVARVYKTSDVSVRGDVEYHDGCANCGVQCPTVWIIVRNATFER